MGVRVNLGQRMVLTWLLFVPALSHVRHSLPVLWIMPLTNNPGQGNLTASVLPAVELALDDLSRQETNLRHYEINFNVIDSECDTAKGLKAFFDAICFGPKYLMIFGGVCPSVTSVIAKSLLGWNLVQLSFAATTPVLDDEKQYPNFFRMVTTDHVVNQAVVKILQDYQWNRVGTLTQDVQRFSEIRSDLSTQLKKADLVVSISESLSADPCVNVNTFRDMDVRIIIGLFDEHSASKEVSMDSPWWVPRELVEEFNASNCTSDHLLMAMEGYITLDFTHLSNSRKQGISGRTPQEYDVTYKRKLLENGLVASKFHGFAYDGVWVIAKVLTRVIESIRQRERYDIYRNFTVSDEVIGQMVLDSMKKTKFEGVTGPVIFRHGERKGPIRLRQFQDGREVKIGEYMARAGVLKLHDNIIQFQGAEPDKDTHPSQGWDVSTQVYIILSVITCLVILTALSFLIFLIKHRNHWVIRKSTQFADYLIILGTVLACSFVFLYGLDGSLLSDEVFETLCTIRAWTLSVGYNITFGSLFVKTKRIWRIVKNKEKKRKNINNDHLWIIIGGLLLVDFGLLLLWQIIDPLKRTLKQFPSVAVPGGEDTNVRLFLEHCESTNLTIWLSILYGYKGFLTLLGCCLALRTRHAQVCDDCESKYTRLSVYNLTVVSIAGASAGFLPQNNPDVQMCFMALAVIWGCSCTLCLAFVPKVLKIRANPTEVNPSIWYQHGPIKEHSESPRSYSSLDQCSGSFESLCNENQRLQRRITEISDQLELLEKDLTPPSGQGHEVKRTAHMRSEDESRTNRKLLDDINSLEHVQRRLSVRLPILHHAYIPATGGMSASCSSLQNSAHVPCAQQKQKT
ncbi:hypothetical protein DPEC_G00140930 [Dallia pectoralis]|uniref:Uncharacterized protein n=1 Tax=Dallia pectoralis TaxID=75939 RepID=A0ACC2GMK0_DALPE|nr:hypothetical protein DPEC_G00140930 [Dallia pectoralis]